MAHFANSYGFEVKVIKDSISPRSGKRITTLQLRYPRFIHSEFMTHRLFSRNASSSRAIPVRKMIENVKKFPARPVEWGTNNPGMQSKGLAGPYQKALGKFLWLASARVATWLASGLNRVGLHKQIVNRILEPFQFIDVVVTATEWENFFDLRDHEDAQPEIRELARLMRRAMETSTAIEREHHLPYVTDEEFIKYSVLQCFAFSIARCARVSYRNHDQSAPDIKKDLGLASMLISAGHMSPTEHQAVAEKGKYSTSGNFVGWVQLRHHPLLENVRQISLDSTKQAA